MPELPEVETVVRTLEQMIKDRKITDIDVIYPGIIAEGTPEKFKERLIGRTFEKFLRRAKFLLFDMGDTMLIVHLRMEGKFYVTDSAEPYNRHTHLIFSLDDGRCLQYNDVRKFGRMWVYAKDEEYTCLKGLGLEPWDEKLTADYLRDKYSHSSKALKTVLLDQSIIAGIGNIYANEICFLSKISPFREVNSLTEEECGSIIASTRQVLSQAIEAGGSTIRSYTSSLGVNGLFQLELNVYMQKECPLCHNRIEKCMLNQRGTYYCRECQK